MSKSEFLAIHDYQHGGVAMIVAATDLDALRQGLGSSWTVLDHGIEDHPAYEYCREKGLAYDFDMPTGLLSQILAEERRTKSGIVLATTNEIEDLHR